MNYSSLVFKKRARSEIQITEATNKTRSSELLFFVEIKIANKP